MQEKVSSNRKIKCTVLNVLMYLSAGIICLILLGLIGYILYRGLPHISPELLSQKPSLIRETVGILPNILNTLYIILITLVIVLPIGVGAAIYLNEYAVNKRVVRIIELATETLSGIPSIIYGLVGMPHVYASQVQYMHENLKYREFVTISLHPHNDRGTGVADTELALLAGADRVEGTLFGNGERTGNVDIITLAMNMYSHGVNPGLDLSNMNYLVEKYENCTRMHVYERAPYAGALVFAAFSGSHQDAIAKGMKFRNKNKQHIWNVPYIPIDPKDIGRTYDADVIRVNSQSGKGGIGYLLEQSFGYNLPAKMREHFSYLCKGVSDHEHKELKPDEVLGIFEENYLNLDCGIEITDFDFMRENEAVKINITFKKDGEETEMEAEGNGSLSAINHALSEFTGENYTLQVFTQHSMQGDGSRSVAASYIGLQNEDGTYFWGAGTDTDVITASTKALFSAFYNMTKGDAK